MFKVGDNVITEKYGSGIVIDIIPPAYLPSDVVCIKYKDKQKRWLYTDFVKHDNQYQRKLKLQKINEKGL